MKTQRYFLKLSYKGTHFFGWQIQPNAITVQEKIMEALTKINRGNSIKVTGCGRTDTGVHASEFYAHFDSETEFDSQKIKHKLNCMLSEDIAIHDFFIVPNDLHSRFSATSRTYNYFIHQEKNPFIEEFSWLVNRELNIQLMNEACLILLKHKNFKCFSKTITGQSSFECDITKAEWTKTESELKFTITANRFLRNMVRAIVGTLVEIGEGKKKLSDLEFILASQDRSSAGISVPAKGLFLSKIEYANDKKYFSPN